ncbi:hypothetical protein Nepgr_013028 [Nepenthes gracilis]|uniref:protein-serine/threonine phosphatase n=1 Tax=Nepenthes gracilis TaxID=150966 RepID=A0AAD3XNA8_NEPGR|nr:hypothetical protein Nepgr_013028 [Nepenthes gracilis]
MEIQRIKFVAGEATSDSDSDLKRQKVEVSTTSSFQREFENAVGSYFVERKSEISEGNEITIYHCKALNLSPSTSRLKIESSSMVPKFGVSSICGRRRDMEDAVAVHPSFCRRQSDTAVEFHYFAVYDGHGCSHVAKTCRERLHELVEEELLRNEEASPEWKEAMERSFSRMDREITALDEGAPGNCRCELQTPQCNAVGSTAVVAIVTPDKIIVANCGDSRAVLCRNGKPIPLSADHKPDRPDELARIEEAGGRVIYWDGPRVLGVLAMSRSIGDNYLKPYVSSEPEVTVTDRTAGDDCLLLASDGLWDVVSNGTACGVARMCLRGKIPPASLVSTSPEVYVNGDVADKACSYASMLLTKLALARHSTDNVSVVVINLRS